MQKVVVRGLPFLVDKFNNLYNFELDKKNVIQIGSYSPDTESYILKENWHTLYSEKLSNYRTNLKNRERKENKPK
jgi:hypothetical protein